jgi:flotillin
MEQDPQVLLSAVVAATSIAVGLFVLIAIARSFLFIGKPNEVLIFSGRQRKLADGSSIGYRELIGGGRSFRIPVLEKVDRMDLSTLPIDIQVHNAYSKGGIPLKVHAVANVKVSPDPGLIKNAIERFMGQNISEIRRVAKETLEGHLRGVLATLTPEEVNEDRLKFASALLGEAEEDFVKLGLALDTLKIQNVSDDVKYLDSIGRKRIAEVIRDAEVAESTAMANAKKSEAESHRAGEVAVQVSETAIVQRENQLRQLRAQLEAEARSEEEMAEAAAQQARAEAERELQELRQQLEAIRLKADVVLPAQASKEAAQLNAQGEAAVIEENGRAMADVLQMLTDAWISAGDDAKDIFLIQQLEEVMRTVVTKVNQVEVTHVTLLDGGEGEALPRHMASFPAMVRQVMEELHRTTGVDVTGILSQSTQEVK